MNPSHRDLHDERKYTPRRDNIPRVLLRGWHAGTVAAALRLNTDKGVYPFAWSFEVLPAPPAEPAPPPPPLTDLTRGEVLALAGRHVGGDTRDFLSAFTSWTADLPTAVFFALGEFDIFGWIVSPEPGHIAVVDLSRRPPPVIHATDLGWRSLPMEYLVHGPVTEGLRVVSVAAIRGCLNCPLFPFCHGVRREPHPVTEEEIRDSVRVGLLFLGAADTHVDVALIIAASLLAWGQVSVRSPMPLGETDLLRAESGQTRPWPQADLDSILSSRLLVHDGAFPPLSGSTLANSLTSTEAWGRRPPAGDDDNTAGTSQPRLTREQWEAAFRDAAGRHTPRDHKCGKFVCRGCGETRPRREPPDLSMPSTLFHCTNRCAAMYDLRGAIDRAQISP